MSQAGAEGRRYGDDLDAILKKAKPKEVDRLLLQTKHFTEDEAEHRDEIVIGYFGKEGISRIVDSVVGEIVSHPLSHPPAMLDVGAGIGTFTIPIASRVRMQWPSSEFYAMDLTPAMLEVLARRTNRITPFVGLAESIPESIEQARSHVAVPRTFDFVVSTLMLHHCPDVKKVFLSFQKVLEPGGRAIIVDLCEHQFVEFREEMGDYHLGFKLSETEALASETFGDVSVEKLPKMCSCSASGRTADLFICVMRKS
ncbi:MAG: class I SAM-dependent methyltransferase [Nitrososphaerales archaeon]